MKRMNLLAGLLFASFCSTGAFAQEGCGDYTVRSGDSLGSIATRVYGSRDQFRIIYDANKSRIADPNLIVVGRVISIPCLTGSSTATTTAAPVAAAERTVLRFLTMPYGDAPFSGVDLPKGGMISEIAMRALEYADPDQEAEIYFIDDPKSHLQTLLPLHAFDVGFTWYRPDCNNMGPLNDADKRRCTAFMATDPVFQDSIGIYARADSPYLAATDYSDLYGAKLCRPRGYFEFDLVQAGLTAPNIEIVKLANSAECLRAVMDGTVDLWSLNVFSAPDELKRAGLENDVVAIPAFEIVLNSYFLISADHPKAQEYVDLLNRGLRKLVETGEWYEIIQWHLTEHNKG